MPPTKVAFETPQIIQFAKKTFADPVKRRWVETKFAMLAVGAAGDAAGRHLREMSDSDPVAYARTVDKIHSLLHLPISETFYKYHLSDVFLAPLSAVLVELEMAALLMLLHAAQHNYHAKDMRKPPNVVTRTIESYKHFTSLGLAAGVEVLGIASEISQAHDRHTALDVKDIAAYNLGIAIYLAGDIFLSNPKLRGVLSHGATELLEKFSEQFRPDFESLMQQNPEIHAQYQQWQTDAKAMAASLTPEDIALQKEAILRLSSESAAWLDAVMKDGKDRWPEGVHSFTEMEKFRQTHEDPARKILL